MENFDGSKAILLLPFLKDVQITFNAQKINEGTAIRVFAHFVERDAERLYTLYMMPSVRSGGLNSEVTWSRMINTLIKRYITDEVLGDALNAVTTISQLPHETENVYADRLETHAYLCTAVFTDQALVNYFIRGLSPTMRDAVAEAAQRLPYHQRTDFSVIRRVAMAEGNTYRALLGRPLPDASGYRTPRTQGAKTTSTPSTGSTLLVDDGPRTAMIAGNAGLLDASEGSRIDPVLVTSAAEALQPPSMTSTDTYATAIQTPVTSIPVTELDISQRIEHFIPEYVPRLTAEQARLAQSIVPKDSSAYQCWLYRIIGHTLYRCPFLNRDQQLYEAYQNYEHQLRTRTRPHMRSLLRQLIGDQEKREPRCNVRFLQNPNRNGFDFRRADTKFPQPGDWRGNGRYQNPSTIQDTVRYLSELVATDLERRSRENDNPVMLTPYVGTNMKPDPYTSGVQASDMLSTVGKLQGSATDSGDSSSTGSQGKQ